MTKLSKQARVATVVGVAMILMYVSLSLAFVMPQGVVKNAARPLISAGSPYFTQKWNVFAPNIAKTNPRLYVQAQWMEGDERVRSEWLDVTSIDFAAIPGHLHPSRAHKTSYNLLNRYLTRYNALNNDQKTIARGTFIKRDGDGFASKTRSELTRELRAHGTNHGQIYAFLREDDIVKEYLTYFSAAYFEKEVVRVRWQIFREYPNRFDDRFADETVRKPSARTFGWRLADNEIDPVKLEIFENYISRNVGDR